MINYKDCKCCENGLVISQVHEDNDWDYEPVECSCPCHQPHKDEEGPIGS
jgi:hypothetical protein